MKDDAKETATSTPLPILVHGTQKVTKFNSQIADDVQVLLAVFRIKSKSTDLVFSSNIPTKTQDGIEVKAEDLHDLKSSFYKFARSLNIVDLGLFG